MTTSDKARETTGNEIAVVGLAGRFPGAATVEHYWENLVAGRDGMTRFTDEELRAAGVEPATIADPAYVKARGVVEGADLFDAAFFGFNPREADMLDPQHRVFLECAWEALEGAGHAAGRGAPVGVFAGVGTSFYLFNLLSNLGGPTGDSVVDTTTATIGTEKDFLATRVSYKLDLRGPSVVVQSACSTSLLAVHLACQSLLSGECDVALAGGVRVSVPQTAGYYAVEGGIMSPDGRCRPFDAQASGTTPGSGVGVVVLRRLADALADGDPIRAVIKGTASNNDGSAKIGYTAPSADAQASVIAEALAVAGVEPETVGMVEAHGTGTPLGDPIEVEGLARAYGAAADRAGSCALGSAKSNLGHLDAAAGIAGFVKAALAVERGVIPPSLNFDAPNPKLGLDATPFYVPTEAREWPAGDGPRRAGVSSFGLGGTNVHVVLEEPPAASRPASRRAWHALALSARTSEALDAATVRLADWLDAHPEAELADVAHTLATGRARFGARRAVACRSAAEAAATLRVLDPARVATHAPGDGRATVAFMFPGGGAQHAGMCRGLYEREPAFREAFDACARPFAGRDGVDVRALAFPEPGGEAAAAATLRRTASALPALFSVEYALAKFWMSLGVSPSAMIGHSLGEYVAACLAGVFSLDDATLLVAARGRLFERLAPGAMLSIPLDEREARERTGEGVDVAAVNAPSLTVASGPREAIDALARRLEREGVACRAVHIDVAAHSRMVEPILDDFRAVVRGIALRAPEIPFVSNVTGSWISADDATDAEYWVRHLRSTVRFGEGVALLVEDEGRVLLECGPGHTLTSLARVAAGPARVVPATRHPLDDRSDEEATAIAAARLWTAGVEVDTSAYYEGESRRRVELPTYPFERRRHWVEPRRTTALAGGRRADVSDWFYLPTWARTLPAAAATDAALRACGARWLVLGAETPVAVALVERLARAGCETVSVVESDELARVEAGRYALAPQSEAHYRALFAEIGGVPDVVVFAWPATDAADGDDEIRLGYTALVALARAIGPVARVDLAVLATGVADATDADRLSPARATLLGPCLVIPQENAGIRLVCVDVGDVHDARTAHAVAAEIAGDAEDALVALRGARRYVRRFQPTPIAEAPSLAPLRERGVYLLTGAFGTVGRIVATHLAEAAGARLALVSRTALPARATWPAYIASGDDEVADRIRFVGALEDAGAEVLALAADVADEAAIASAVEAAVARFGRIDGVFHAAGVVRGASILVPHTEVGEAEAREQFGAKIGGTLALDRALAGREVDFKLLFSSNASVLGGLGLVAYAAANAFVDAFASASADAESPWTSATWDGWGATAGRERHTSIAELATTPTESISALRRILSRVPGGAVVVSAGDFAERYGFWVRRAFRRAETSAPAPMHERPALATGYREPATEAERGVAAIWQALLGIERVGADDNFFALGGHSLLAVQVVSRLRAAFGVEPSLRAIFESPTVAGLAARIDELAAENAYGAACVPPIEPVSRDSALAPSFGQQRLWLLDRFEPDTAVYNIPGGLRLRGPLDAAALARAIEELGRRHEAFRTRFVEVDGRPVQVVDAEASLRLATRDLRVLDPESRRDAARALALALVRAPFDLATAPLARLLLARTDDEEHELSFALHHTIADGWSLGVLVRELTLLYAAFSEGRPSPLAELPLQYADFAAWQRAWLSGATLDAELDYWRERLAGSPPALDLPTDRPRPPARTYPGARADYALDREVADAVGALAREEGATLFVVALAALAAVLARRGGTADVVVGTPTANRTRGEFEDVIGFFVNTLALRVDASGDPTFRELVARAKWTALGAYAHQDVPFETVLDALGVERDLARSPLFQVMLVLLNPLDRGEALDGIALEWLDVETATAKFDLTLMLTERDDGVGVSIEYNTDLYDRETVDRLFAHFASALSHGVAAPDERTGRALALPDAERALIAAWNRTAHEYGETRPIPELVAARAAETPDAEALAFADERLTFRELLGRADALASALVARGVGPESRVGVLLDRSVELVVALLAAMRAGAAYVPLDPEHPAGRLAAVAEDARLDAILSARRFADLVPSAACPTLFAEDGWGGGDPERALPAIDPDTPAYVIFTSGSTGRPKGVAVPHDAIRNRLLWMAAEYRVTPADRILQKTPFGFDVSVWELFLPLVTGACLVVARPGEHRDPEALAATIARERVTVLHFVPSMLGAALDEGSIGRCATVRDVICSGEALGRDLVDRFHASHGARLHNLYGPTEAAVDVTSWACERDGARRTVPIGRPIANVETYVLDARLEPVPVGVAGELYLGGVALARGYVGRPGLTAAAFVPDPVSGRGGARLYRTGDLARFAADGAIEYLGRLDHQVKIRGNRVELGEIEVALGETDGVRDAVVVASAGRSGEPRLVAYVVADEGATGERLAAALRARVPEYMVPAAWVFLDAIPLSPNGKADRKALPEPDAEPATAARAYVAPRTEAERALCEVWAGVLGLARVGVDDNFFELGGDSILSIQAVARARRAGLSFAPKDLFASPTVAALAAIATPATAEPLAEQGVVAGEAPLTPIQRRFLDGAPLDPEHFDQTLLLEVPAGANGDALESAVAAVVSHHDALRARFRRDGDGGWRQSFDGLDALAPFERRALPSDPLARAEAVRDAAADLRASLDLAGGPLFRAAHLVAEDGPGRLLLVAHHFVVDGVSWRVLLEDLRTAYDAAARGDRVALPAKTTSAREWAIRLDRLAGSGALDGEVEFWERSLAGSWARVAEASADDTVGSARTVEVELDAETTRRLLGETPAAFRTRIDDALLGALGLAFARWRGDGRVLVDVEGHGREPLVDGCDLSRTVGWFTSISPVGLDVDADAGPVAALVGAKERLRAVPNRGASFGALRSLGPEAVRERLAALPTADVLFNYLGRLDGDDGGFAGAAEPTGHGRSPRARRTHAIEVAASVADGRLRAGFAYGEAVLAREDVERLAGYFAAALGEIVASCAEAGAGGCTPSDFPLAALDAVELDAVVADRRDVEDVYPLTPMQAGLVFHTLLSPESRDYVEQISCALDGDLDVEAFRAAWRDAAAANAVLRTGFAWEGVREPIQVVRAATEIPIRVVDARHGDDVDALARADRETSFDLGAPPLLRLTLARTGERTHALVFTYHHAILDGWSVPQLLSRVFRAYAARTRGETPAIPAARPYRDYVAWLRGRDRDAAERFWRERLAGFRAATPVGSARAAHAPSFADARASLTSEETAALTAFARRNGLTVNTVVEGAWALLLARGSGERDVVFGTTVSGRPADLVGVDRTVGLFVNTLPTRVAVDERAAAVTWLAELQRRDAEHREFEYASLADVRSWSEARGEVGLFETLLVFENYPVDAAVREGASDVALEIRDLRVVERTHYAVTAVVAPGERLSVRLTYDAARFGEAEIERTLDRLRTTLVALAGADGRVLADVASISADERRLVLHDWNRAGAEVRSDACLHELVEAQAARTPDAVAVVDGDREVTYAELDARAHRLARRLVAAGVAPGDLVGVCAARSHRLVAALLATLESGAAYVPLDPAYPHARLAETLADSGARIVLGDASAAALGDLDGVTVLDLDDESLDAECGRLERRATPRDLAYVLYTSGSTGRPKGVAIEHRSAVALVEWARSVYSDADLAGVCFGTSICFDLSVFELFVPLATGGTVVVVENGLAVPASPSAGRVTLLNTVPSAAAELCRAEWRGSSLRVVNLAGEALTAALAADVFERLAPERLYNLYGPTEDTTYSTYVEVARDAGAAPSIGRPLANTRAYVLDDRLEPVPVGAVGQVYLAGAGNARGYLDRPGLTAVRFVPDPHGREPGGRMYATGDLARFGDHGALEYVGRADHQVKVRGFRVELGEVESRLAEHPDVCDVVVAAPVDAGGVARLVAYVVPAEGAGDAAVLAQALKRFALDRLPAYMSPSAVVALDALPRTPNGKVDRRALPDPEPARVETVAFRAPSTDAEREIAAAWRSVLGVERVGLDDNFFDLGGTSLHLMRLAGLLGPALGVEVSLRDLFDRPTVAALARALGERAGAATADGDEKTELERRASAGKERLRQRRVGRAAATGGRRNES